MARIAMFAALFTVAFASNDVITLPFGGSIQGISTDTYRSFLGIPFGAPPVGNLRFSPPHPAATWSGIRNATQFGPDCPQSGASDEDCLYLNVWTPRAALSSDLPVMLWFYGGCWEQGSTSDPLWNGQHLVQATERVIVVSANYRLGPFGFLGSASLAAESGTTGNYGLLDQRLAMHWVQENIKVFGGDPSKVTLFGQSAGSGSIADHIIMPNSNGLYHQAILESGPYADWIARPMEVAQAQFDALVIKSGCNASSDSLILACLRNLTADQLRHAESGCSTECCYYPVIDGVEIIEAPPRLVEKGSFNHVPLMLGTTMNEGSTFLHIDYNISVADYEAYVYSYYGSSLGGTILSLYPASGYKSPWWAACEIWTHSYMTCPARRSARWLTGHGSSAYVYYWTHVIEETKFFEPSLGAFHGVELPFVFHDPDGKYHGYPIAFTPGEMLLKRKIEEFWTNFAVTGNPNKEHSSTWPLFDLKAQQNIVLNDQVSVDSFLFEKFCDFWDVAQNYTVVYF